MFEITPIIHMAEIAIDLVPDKLSCLRIEDKDVVAKTNIYNLLYASSVLEAWEARAGEHIYLGSPALIINDSKTRGDRWVRSTGNPPTN